MPAAASGARSLSEAGAAPLMRWCLAAAPARRFGDVVEALGLTARQVQRQEYRGEGHGHSHNNGTPSPRS